MIPFSLKNIIIPSMYCSLILLKSNDKYYVYVYNNNFFFIVGLSRSESSVMLDKNTSSISLSAGSNYSRLLVAHEHNKNLFDLLGRSLNCWINSWDSYYFKKIKFKGKVYKITKLKNNNIKLSFGRCHKNVVVVRSATIIKKKKIKNKVFIFSVNKGYLSTATSLITNTRSINLFTQRGLRCAKQLVYRKIGKKSSYSTK